MGAVSGPLRCVWLEARPGGRVICVSRGLPSRQPWTFAHLELFAVVRPLLPIRAGVLGGSLNRVIEALEYVPEDLLGAAVELLEAGFMVSR